MVYQDEEFIEIEILPEVAPTSQAVGGRALYEEIFADNLKSNQCKVDCIDKDLIFCPGDNYRTGVCCDPKVDARCPTGKTDYEVWYYQ